MCRNRHSCGVLCYQLFRILTHVQFRRWERGKRLGEMVRCEVLEEIIGK